MSAGHHPVLEKMQNKCGSTVKSHLVDCSLTLPREGGTRAES